VGQGGGGGTVRGGSAETVGQHKTGTEEGITGAGKNGAGGGKCRGRGGGGAGGGGTQRWGLWSCGVDYDRADKASF